MTSVCYPDPTNYDILNQDSNSMTSDPSLYTAVWNPKDSAVKMEDDVGDDIFQVDKSDLIQGKLNVVKF